MRSIRLFVIAMAVATVVGACGGGAPQPGTLSSRWAAPPILSHVPADTPYLFAVLEPMSEALRRRTMQGFDQRFVDALRKLDQTSGMGRDNPAPWIRVVMALADEVKGKDPDKWGEQLGFDPRGRFVLYGLSAWPVVRVDVAQPARLRTVIEHVLATAGLSPQQRSLEGHSYWVAGGPELSFVAAVLDREFVAALVPSGALDQTLPEVLGIRAPTASLASTTTVPDLLARHRFLGVVLGYLDAHRIVEIIAGARPGPLDAPLRAGIGAVSPACRADLDRLADIAPRIAIGYRRLDEISFDGSLVFETPPGVVSGLRKLHAMVPEVTAPLAGHPLFALGAAIDPRELVEWLRGLTRQLQDHPFGCPWFKGINEAGRELAQALARPLPPTWLGVRGFSLTIDDASVRPPGVAGHLVVAGDRVADLVQSLAGTLPAFAGIPLSRDGRPIALPLQQLQIPVRSAHLALTTDRLVIAAGDDSARRATEHLATPVPRRSPLALMAFDLPRFQQLLVSFGQPPLDQAAYLRDVGMSLDVVETGISFDVWGTWAAPPAMQAR
ncbi:MAG: hypothetical protein E6J90_14705 [Deltaproteobacteria bacterium]|nr:MAG: hypothetical protein E6J91_33165 [Deltaproteobacteria bacterium]TMQ21204.1 MAG: hypothetical protein E6J90_14705 [Deltaproteobacteria bacterium]